MDCPLVGRSSPHGWAGFGDFPILLGDLVAIYRDNDVDRYYEPTLVSNYGVRYPLFAGVIATLAVTAILVPLIIRFTNQLVSRVENFGIH